MVRPERHRSPRSNLHKGDSSPHTESISDCWSRGQAKTNINQTAFEHGCRSNLVNYKKFKGSVTFAPHQSQNRASEWLILLHLEHEIIFPSVEG